MTDNENDRPRSSLTVWLTVAVVLLPVVYVLSVGPIVGYVVANPNVSNQTKARIMFFYAPLAWLYDNSESAKAAFDWYFAFWK